MEQMKVPESKAIEVVAGEPDPLLTENARRVLEKRYLRKDERGRVVETPKELFARVAWNLALARRNYLVARVNLAHATGTLGEEGGAAPEAAREAWRPAESPIGIVREIFTGEPRLSR